MFKDLLAQATHEEIRLLLVECRQLNKNWARMRNKIIMRKLLNMDYIRLRRQTDFKSHLLNVWLVESHWLNIRYVKQTPEICRVAVATTPSTLAFIKKQTYEICIQAVSVDHEVLCHVKSDLFSPMEMEQIFLTAINHCNDDSALRTIENYKKATRELRLAAVRRNGSALQWIPASAQTPEIIKAALEQNPTAIRFVKNGVKEESKCG